MPRAGCLGTFPSPCGEKVGINLSSFIPALHVAGVSVPLRGKGRDQHPPKTLNTDILVAFPSPCGEKVGINRKSPSRSKSGGKPAVSVPLRGKGRDQLVNRRLGTQHNSAGVSVPLRGKGRDQPPPAMAQSSGLTVSVPLRGKGRDQPLVELVKTGSTAFPSPCGEKVGINAPTPAGSSGPAASSPFPSPCGEKVGINKWPSPSKGHR